MHWKKCRKCWTFSSQRINYQVLHRVRIKFNEKINSAIGKQCMNKTMHACSQRYQTTIFLRWMPQEWEESDMILEVDCTVMTRGTYETR